MLLEERGRSVRVAQDGEGAIRIVRHRPFTDRGEIFRELEFRDAVVRVEHAIGMREPLTADLRVAGARALAARAAAGCLLARNRGRSLPGATFPHVFSMH